MNLINYKNKIYLEFYSSSKLVKKSLNLEYNKQNLAYATKTLLPIFIKLSTQSPKHYHHIRKISHKIKNKTKSSKTLMQFCDDILSDLTVTSKKSTIKTASYAIKRFFDFIENKNITNYCVHDIQTAIFGMKKANLSAKTIHLLLVYPTLAFKKAKQLNLIKQIPSAYIKKPKISSKPKTSFNTNQIYNILKYAKAELKTFLYIAFYTGARSGEILALTTNDIEFSKSVIHINKNQTRYELTTPKNGKTRQILMPEKLISYLIKQDFKSEKIFSSDYFKIYYEFKKLLKTLNYPSCGLHSTRHTYTTQLMQNCISPTFIANSLGHSSLDLVNKTYSHYLFDKKEIKKVNKKIKF